jgi:succinate dehydrogenase/fumarate reductase cytochrome b subunit
MKKTFLASLFIFILPLVTNAANGIQTFLLNFMVFLNDTIVPFLMGIALLFFIVNVVRYFIIGSTNEDGREKAKALAVYGVSAFVSIVIFWGIINMFASSIGLDGYTQPKPDYCPNPPIPGIIC